MKNKGLLFLGFASLLLSQSKVYALTGNANVEFVGENEVNVGEMFTVKMNVSSSENGIVSLEGNLNFDKDMIEYVSSNEVNTPYEFHINEDYNYKLAGLDFTLENGILENTTVYEFTFKAIKEGNTEITLKNYKLTDRDDYVNTSLVGKNITIKKVEEEKIEVEEVNEKIEVVEEPRIEKQNMVKESKKIEEKLETKNEIKNNKKAFFDKLANIILNKIMRIFK